MRPRQLHTLIARAAVLLGSTISPVLAGVLYDNGAPNFSNGFEMGIRVLADDFTLSASASPAAVRFWSMSADASSGFNGSIYWAIYTDATGFPGVQIASDSGLANATQTFLGLGSNSVAPYEFMYDFQIGPLAPLAAGKYWLILHNGSLGQNQYTGFFWSLSAPNGSSISQQSVLVQGGFGTNVSGWFSNGTQLAFELFDAQVPEPGSFVLVTLGALVLGRCLILQRERRARDKIRHTLASQASG